MTFDPDLARRQAAIAPEVHEGLGTDGLPSRRLQSQLRAAAAEVGLEPEFRRWLVLDRLHWHAVLQTRRGQVSAVVNLHVNADSAWREAFAQIGLEL